MLRRLYDWTMRLAGSRHAVPALAAISFAESSFFPIPPDVILVPMALANPPRARYYALVCTIASVLGGLLGYAIGALLYDTVGAWLISAYGYGERMDEFRAAYAEWGALIILIKGLTPIPFKLVTIASGFAGYDLLWFVVLSIITPRLSLLPRGGTVAALRGADTRLHRPPAQSRHHRGGDRHRRRIRDRALCGVSGIGEAIRRPDRTQCPR